MSIMLSSVDAVKEYLELDKTKEDFTSLLANIIKYISDRIQVYLNRKLEKTERTQYFQSGKRLYYVDAYPVDSTASITVMLDASLQTLGEDYWVWYDSGKFEFDVRTLYVEPKDLYITWTGGYNATPTVVGSTTETVLLYDIPDSMKYACVLQSAFAFTRRKDLGVGSMSMPDGSFNVTVLSDDLLPGVKKILNHYRKTSMGAT